MSLVVVDENGNASCDPAAVTVSVIDPPVFEARLHTAETDVLHLHAIPGYVSEDWNTPGFACTGAFPTADWPPLGRAAGDPVFIGLYGGADTAILVPAPTVGIGVAVHSWEHPATAVGTLDILVDGVVVSEQTVDLGENGSVLAGWFVVEQREFIEDGRVFWDFP